MELWTLVELLKVNFCYCKVSFVWFLFNILFLLHVFPSFFIVQKKEDVTWSSLYGFPTIHGTWIKKHGFVECCLCCSFLGVLPPFIAINSSLYSKLSLELPFELQTHYPCGCLLGCINFSNNSLRHNGRISWTKTESPAERKPKRLTPWLISSSVSQRTFWKTSLRKQF